jgi:hypothetical protein
VAFVIQVAMGRMLRARRELGLAAGFLVGIAVGLMWLGVRCHWPPREDQDRLLLVLLPLAVLTDVVGAWPRLRWPAVALRGLACAACGPVILWGSIYLSDAAGPGSRLLSIPTLILLELFATALMASAWRLLLHAQPHMPRPAVGVALAMTLAAASAATLLSGYASAGLTGLILASAIAGTSVGTALNPHEEPRCSHRRQTVGARESDVRIQSARADLDRTDAESSPADMRARSGERGANAHPLPGIPLVALAGVLLQGRFFGELNSVYAMGLWITPPMAAVIALAALRGRRPWMMCAVLWLLVALAGGAIVLLTYQEFARDAVEGYAVARQV